MPATHLESTRSSTGQRGPRPRTDNRWDPNIRSNSASDGNAVGPSVAWVANARQVKGSSRASPFQAKWASAGKRQVTVSRLRRSAFWIVGVLGVLIAGSATPQGNIDAGKSPAQLFADTCSNCHRRPQELKRSSASFLRQHYTPGAQEAAAMATYLSSIPPDPRAKDRPKAPEKDKEKAKAQQHQQAQERPLPKGQQPVLKGKRPEVAKPDAGEPPPAEAPQEVRVEAPPVPKLEPFEE
jgi:mono/diheme cytochrome c family protein